MALHAAQDERSDRTSMTSVDFSFRRSGSPGSQLGNLVDDVEHAELPAVVGTVLDEVVGPDMVGTLWSEPHTRAVIQQSCPFLSCLPGTLSPSWRRCARPA